LLRYIRRSLKKNAFLLEFGLGEYWRFPELKEEMSFAPKAARQLLEDALIQARPALRAEVEPGATALSLLGLVVLSVTWQARGWLDWSDEHWEQALEAVVRPLVQP
jgi:hypothetical protein